MTSTPRIVITGQAARDIASHVRAYILPRLRGPWSTEVQGMHECGHGCKLYVRRQGAVLRYVIHLTAYGCGLGEDPATRTVPVSVRPAEPNRVSLRKDSFWQRAAAAVAASRNAMRQADQSAAFGHGWSLELRDGSAWSIDDHAQPLIRVQLTGCVLDGHSAVGCVACQTRSMEERPR